MTDIAKLIDEIKDLKPTTRSITGEPFSNFAPPATELELNSLEQYCGHELPRHFREYLMLHNGQLETTYEHKGETFVTGMGAIPTIRRLLSCLQIIEKSKMLTNVLSTDNDIENLPIRDCSWHPRLLMFSERDGSGYGIDPVNNEVISWDHDGGPVRTASSNLVEFLENIIRQMEQIQIS